MPTTAKINSADNPLAPDFSSVVALLGPSELGVVGNCYQVSPGQEPYDSMGGGWLSEDTAGLVSQGASVVAVPVTTTAGSIGAVTHRDAADDGAGTGPVITIAGTPLLDLPSFKMRVSSAGDRDSGAAVLAVAFDGSTEVLYQPIPPAAQATLIGSVDLTALTLSTLNAETLLLTPDDHAEMTVTFTTPTTIQGIADQINTVAIAATSAMRASITQGKYLKITSGTHGTGSTLSCNVSSTADGTLGISNSAAAGADATATLPYTGIELTFASGVYLLDETYAAAVTGPAMSQTALLAAAATLRASGIPFGQLLIAAPATDGAGLRALIDALSPVLATWGTGAEAMWAPAIVAGPLGGTGDTAIATNDNDVKAAMLGQVDKLITVAHGDAYTPGHRVQGKHRRSIAVPLAARLAVNSLSKDPGYGAFGSLPGVAMTGPDGSTKARNEATATVKMGGSQGPGFTVLTTKRNDPYVVHGVTRAGPTSRYVHIGVLRMALRAAGILFAFAQTYENWDPLLAPNGTIRSADADMAEEQANELLAQGIIREPNSHASAASTAVSRTEVIANTDNLPIAATIQMKGQAENISLTITTTGVLTLAEAA